MTIRNFAIAPALLATALVLSACSGSEAPAEHAEAPGHAAPTSSSAGLPDGNIAAGEKLASTKGEATGQSCVDCHGAEGTAPIDPTYPTIGGQYADYIGHSLQAYRNGDRQHALMSSQAKALTDQQIADLAAYFGTRDSGLVTLHGAHD
ncbi:c-type cytochrome [Lysobacter sp. F6437]|uniref:c-type cytochrome n=1 Tax=Lysobacter sp. F6437 TaxID=3459296 RepID=UPI00403E26F0